MKATVITICVVLLALIATGWAVYYDFKRDSAVIEKLRTKKDSIVNLDSLQSAITEAILDSVNQDLVKRDREILKLSNELKNQRRQNEELLKKYNSLRVNMPEF